MNIYFDEDNNEIKLKPIYYSRRQLAEELEVPYSTITYWAQKFKDFFEGDMDGRNKKFTAKDVELFKLIKMMLKEKGFTVEQVLQHLEENYEKLYNGMKIDNETTSELVINNILDDRIDKKLAEFKNGLVEEISDNIANKISELFKVNYLATEERLEDIKSELSLSIVNELEEKTNNLKNEVKKNIEESNEKSRNNVSKEMKAILEEIESINQEIKESNNDVALRVKDMLEHRKQEQLELEKRREEQNKSKGLFARIFGK